MPIIRQRQPETIDVYVKVVYTSITGTYKILKNINTGEFLRQIKECIKNDLNIDSESYELIDLDEVKEENVRSEEASAFNPLYLNRNISYYLPSKNLIVLYIRPITQIENEIEIEIESDECVICYNTNTVLQTSYNCSHLICESCFHTNYVRYNRRCCPICRNLI